MEEREYIKGNVHKLIVDDGAITFTVGKENPSIESKIVEIVEDIAFFNECQKVKFLIVCEDAKKVRWLWNEVCDKPYVIQYAKPNGQEYINYHD